MRYYDTRNKQLIYIEQAATPEFWDHQWEDEELKKSILAGAKERFVFSNTKRYLAPGSKILEGGCGKGQFVYSLQSRGYDAHGVDFAQKTVEKVTGLLPALKIHLGDVRHLDFSDASFDGYWSLGVIEHFLEGYEAIALEMHRVLKPEGYLFLTFPYMSPLRRLKAFFSVYPTLQKNKVHPSSFYQFALPAPAVIHTFQALGFDLIRKQPYEGFKGFKDESGVLKPFLQKIYNNKSLPGRLLSYIFSMLFAPLASHTILLILRKRA